MRSLFAISLLAIAGTACANSSALSPVAEAPATPTAAHAEMSPPMAAPPVVTGSIGNADMLGEVDPYAQVGPRVIAVGETIRLVAGTAETPFVWRVLDRDKAMGRIDGGHTFVGLAPGGVTLELKAGQRTAWVHEVVRDPASADRYSFSPHGHPTTPAFERPVVARDAVAWGRIWAGWWGGGALEVVQPQIHSTPAPWRLLQADPEPYTDRVSIAQPIPGPIGPTGAPAPPPAPAIDFATRCVLMVSLDQGGPVLDRPVVTHIVANVVYLAVPAMIWNDESAVVLRPVIEGQPQTSGPPSGPQGYAFDVPSLPPGVSVRLAPFPEGRPSAQISELPEDLAGVPFAAASPSMVLPNALAGWTFGTVGTSLFEMPSPQDLSPFTQDTGADTGVLEGQIWDDQRIGCRVVVRWEPAGAPHLADAAEAAARRGGTTATQAVWSGELGWVFEHRSFEAGRPTHEQSWLADHAGRRFRLTVTSFDDVTRHPAFEALGASMVSGWRWR